jgi:hypothetical protein
MHQEYSFATVSIQETFSRTDSGHSRQTIEQTREVEENFSFPNPLHSGLREGFSSCPCPHNLHEKIPKSQPALLQANFNI